MEQSDVLRRIARSLSSFEGYKPLSCDSGGYVEIAKSAGPVSIWQQSPDRSAVQIDDKYFTKSAWFFFTDCKLTEDQVKRAFLDGLGIEILSNDAYERVFDTYRDAQRRKFGLLSYAKTSEIRKSHGTYIFGGTEPSETVDVSAAGDGRYGLNETTFRGILKRNGIAVDTDAQYRFVISEKYSISGSPGYVLSDRCEAKAIKGHCAEWLSFCSTFGLRPATAGYVNSTWLMAKDNPMSLFSYSMNGGCRTERFAINVATGYIVASDDALDLTHHKGGWSYAHKYMGRYAFSPNMEIVTMMDDTRFALSNEYSIENDKEWLSKVLVKIARLLYAWGVPEEAILEVPLYGETNRDDRHTAYCSIPVLAKAEPVYSSVSSHMHRGYQHYEGSSLDKDPLVQNIRKTYARVITAPVGLKSGAEKHLLRYLKRFANMLNVAGPKVTEAFARAEVTEALVDIEIVKELVHSGARKTPLLGLIYGADTNADEIFIERGSSLETRLRRERALTCTD